MSTHLRERQDGAIHLFGALSGVDEIYLSACEKNLRKSKRAVTFLHKYGKYAAAVLCLVMLGAGYAGMQSVKEVTMEKTENTTAADLQETPNQMARDSVEEVCPEEAEGAKLGKEALSEICVTEKTITLEEARSIRTVGEYIPVSLTDEGEILSVEGDGKTGAEWIKIRCNDAGTGEFMLKISALGEDEMLVVFDSDSIFEAKEFDRSCVERVFEKEEQENAAKGENAEESKREIGVLYETETGYVLVEFIGDGTEEEVWALFE